MTAETTVPGPTLEPHDLHATLARLTAPGEMFEVRREEVFGTTHSAFASALPTLTDLFATARMHGDGDFLVEGDRRWTFNQFLDDAAKVSAWLAANGLGAGERVVIAMRNCPEWMLAFAGASMLGAVVAPVSAWGNRAELDHAIRDADPSLIAVDSRRLRTAEDTLADLGVPVVLVGGVGGGSDTDADAGTGAANAADVVVNAISTIPFSDLLDHQLPAPETPEVSGDDLALLMYTSGSTGRAKGVMYRQGAVGQTLMNLFFQGFLTMEVGGAVQLRGGATVESQLVTIPLFHGTGLFAGFLIPLVAGQKVALLPKWDTVEAMRVIEAERVTMVSTVPAILKDLLLHPRFDEFDLGCLSRVAAAGAATPADLRELIRERIGDVSRSTGYGMTETSAVCSTMTGPVYDLKPHTAGYLSPVIEFRTAAPDDPVRIDPTGRTEGEIQLRGVTVTPGYWRRDDLTAEAFTSDGWLCTGDIGHLDEDRFVHITGRIKEIINRGGENIAPSEIEEAVYSHPRVKEASVFGVPDDRLGEVPALVSFPVEGTELDPEELRAHLAGELAAHKVPRDIVRSPGPLPRNASLKLNRLSVRRSFLENS